MFRKIIVTAATVFGLGAASIAANAAGPVMLNDMELDALTAGSAVDGGNIALSSPGFAVSSEANGRGLLQATYIFGNNGKGNGADPDSLGLAVDHDPGVLGGGPDTTR